MKPMIFLPAYNTGNSIHQVLTALSAFKDNVLIVNDGSTDNTLQIIKSSHYKFISLPINKGIGNAIIVGLNYAIQNNYTHFITLDSDGQHDCSYIDKFIEKLVHSDYVLGNRFSDINCIPTPKIASNFLGSIITQKLFNVWVSDISCGFRGFKILKDIANLPFNKYNYVFEQLYYLLNKKSKFIKVDMPAIYPIDTLLCTRKEELLCFLITAIKYCDQPDFLNDLKSIHNNIILNNNFDFIINDIRFFFFVHHENNSYILQTDVSKAIKHYL